MIRNDWTRTNSTIFGFRCIKHRITKELCISGSAGDIWQYSDGELRMVLKPSGVRAKILKLLGLKNDFDSRNERVVSFDPRYLPAVIEAANMSLFIGEQLRWANQFGER